MTISKIYQEELRKSIKKRVKGIIDPTENVLYFPNNIDVRICPKNGMTSLKWVAMHLNGIEISSKNPISLIYGTKRHRISEISKYGHRESLPFRKDSYRVAIARDPVKRFLSACEYIKSEYVRVNEVLDLNSGRELSQDELKVLGSMSDVDILPDRLDDVIDGVISGEIQNTHFYTQTYYHGNLGQYNKVFKMREFNQFLDWIAKQCSYPNDLKNVHVNRTSALHYGTKDSLTRNQKERIMGIYKEDYRYGWTED